MMARMVLRVHRVLRGLWGLKVKLAHKVQQDLRVCRASKEKLAHKAKRVHRVLPVLMLQSRELLQPTSSWRRPIMS